MSVAKLLDLLAAHPDAARAIRTIIFYAMPESKRNPPNVEQAAAVITQAAGLTALDLISDPTQMLALIRAIGPAVARMPIVRLELDTQNKWGHVGLPEEDVHALIEPHRHRLREAWLVFTPRTSDARFLGGTWPAMRIFTARGLAAATVAGVVNASPAIYSLGLDQYQSVVPLLNEGPRGRIETVWLHFDDPDLARLELDDASLDAFPAPLQLKVVNAMLHDEIGFLESSESPDFMILDDDGWVDSEYLANVVEEEVLPALRQLTYRADTKLWGDRPGFVDEVKALAAVCRDQRIVFVHDDD